MTVPSPLAAGDQSSICLQRLYCLPQPVELVPVGSDGWQRGNMRKRVATTRSVLWSLAC